jgi:opacity protein-like surface antigen
MTNIHLESHKLLDMHRDSPGALTLKRRLNMKTFNLKNAAITTALVLVLPVVQAGDWTGNIGGSIGSKHLDDNDWSSLDSQEALGFMLDVKKKSWPVSITYDLIGSYEENKNGSLKDEAYTVENQIGIRKTFELESWKMRPYIGGGVTSVSAEIKNKTATTSVKDNDDGTGVWIGAGWYVDVSESFDIGFDVRYSEAEVTLFNQDIEAGGMHYAATASYHW